MQGSSQLLLNGSPLQTVYAAGLYVDEEAARRKLGGQYECLPAVSLAANQSFLDGEKVVVACVSTVVVCFFTFTQELLCC